MSTECSTESAVQSVEHSECGVLSAAYKEKCRVQHGGCREEWSMQSTVSRVHYAECVIQRALGIVQFARIEFWVGG